MAERWSEAQDVKLRALYAAGAPIRQVARELGRSEDAAVARRRALGIAPRRMPRPWSPREELLLRSALAAGIPIRILAARLERSPAELRARRRQLGLPTPPAGRRYTPLEETLLRDGLANGSSWSELARRLNRTRGAARAHADALGLIAPERRRYWTALEDAVLRDGYAEGLTCAEIAGGLPDRTEGAVAARARKLGLATYARRWSRAEDARLRALAARCPPAQLARMLGRTPEAIRRRARRLAVALRAPSDPGGGGRWTPAEDELLRLHANQNPALLMVQLRRSDGAIARRLQKLELRQQRHRSPHHPAPSIGGLTPGEWQLVERELSPVSARKTLALARRLERSPQSLRALAARRGTAGAGGP